MADFLGKNAKKSARVYVDVPSASSSAARRATIDVKDESAGHQCPPTQHRRTIAAVTRQLSHDISTEQLISDQLIDGKVADEEEDKDGDHDSDDDGEDNNRAKRPLSASRPSGQRGLTSTATDATGKPELYRIQSHSALSSLEDKSKPTASTSSSRPMAKPHKLTPLPGSTTLARNKPDAIQTPSPDVCLKCRESADMPPPHCAAFSGHAACLQALLPVQSRPRDAEQWLDKKRRTPLFYACAANRLECVDLLLRWHAEWLEVADKQLDLPVHVCCFFGWDACLRKLLDVGANPHVRNAKGFKPSHIAKTEQCLEILLSFGDDLLQGDKLGRTPLFVACARDRSACVEFLCAWNHRSRSWMLEQEDQRGDRPIHAAACNGSASSLEILLRYGVDLLIMNAKGLTPKDLAAANRHDKCVELLSKAEVAQSSGTTWFAPANAATSADVGDNTASEWVECWDNDSGQPFYYNNLSGKCQWEVPDEFTPQLYAQHYQQQQNQEEEQEDNGGEYVWVKKKKQTVTVVTGKETDWIAVQDPVSRAIYYKNTRTGQSQWEEPDDVRQLQNAVGAKASQEASRIWEELEQARTSLAAAVAREKRRQLAAHKHTLEVCKLHIRQRKEDMAKREEQARLAQLLPRSSFIRRKKQSMMMKVSTHNSNARRTNGMKSSLAVLDEQQATGSTCDEKVEDICSREPALDIFLSTYLRLHGVRDLQVLTAEKRFCNCLFHYYVALVDPIHIKGLSKSQFRAVLRDALIIPSAAAASSSFAPTSTSSSTYLSLTAAGLTTGPPLKLYVIDLIFAQAERAVALEASSSLAPSSPSSSLLHHRQAAATAMAPGGETHLTISGFTTAMQIVRERVVTQVEQNDDSTEIEDDEEWFLLTFLVPLALKLGARLLTQIRQCKELELQVAASSRAQELLAANRLAIQVLHRHYSAREPALKMLSFRGLAQLALDFALVPNSSALPALQFLLEAVHWICGNAHTEIVSFEKFQQVLTMLASLPLPSIGVNSVNTTSVSFVSGSTATEDKIVKDLAVLFGRLTSCPAIHLVDSPLHSFGGETATATSDGGDRKSNQARGITHTASMASLSVVPK